MEMRNYTELYDGYGPFIAPTILSEDEIEDIEWDDDEEDTCFD